MSDWISTFPGYKQVLTTAKKTFGRIIRTGPVPKHVGIIMDGNRRYAKSHNLEIKEGHSLGFDSMASVLELLYESGVECATVYAFSIENFKRSTVEVKWLMDLAKSKFRQINNHGELCEEYGVKVRILGNKSLLPDDVLEILNETEEISKNNTRAVLNVCFPYTSRDEITHSVRETVRECMGNPNMIINEQTLDDHLYTKDSPKLDLLVRTSGTFRLSDFLLWQCVSPDCAIVFIDKLWPAFRPWDMAKILINWGFNKYWYGGHANGYPHAYKRIKHDEDDDDEEEEEEVNGMLEANGVSETNGSSGFKRYDAEQ
ncbi:uncharacterized protein SPAPADRAFT_63072 [Spathaspora passalidarum NRRL Y-27907]|uniref:Alkyl transferase n=1 Tax=Spathaspora passalidarum (strain NRRL Y-27907 / 11-Y1) TaxID=619300 RepID=G3ASU3_SPAPN|nr:uncharacterized protein SPAPADRAFT_63072 [Spathaspora passalidarum NRRL Y-27907]EGW31157.1 hypothetical protein SPAPADRAFT_63072 [Spathaspora passalidarum NRRL Y-27907]